MEKLLTFKDWIKNVYRLTHLELMIKPVEFQQQVHRHYTDYVAVWENEEIEKSLDGHPDLIK